MKQDSSFLHYRAIWPETISLKTDIDTKPNIKTEADEKLLQDTEEDDTEALIHNYFNLTPNLTSLYEQWAAADPNFRKRAPKFTGVRILKQDAWEALIGFICSSNNNIARISQMVCDKTKTTNTGFIDKSIRSRRYASIMEPSLATLEIRPFMISHHLKPLLA